MTRRCFHTARRIRWMESLAGIVLAMVVLGARTSTCAAEPGEQRMWEAARQGDVQQVRELLAAGVDVNARTEYGATALSYAADRGHVEVVRALLEAGADVQVTDSFYHATPLSWAASAGHGDVVALLLQYGAKGADDALKTAAEKGFVDVARAVMDSEKVNPDQIRACRELAADRNHDDVVRLLDERLGPPPKSPSVDLKRLQSYTGLYQSDRGWEYEIGLKGDHLTIGSPYQEPVRLETLDDHTFRFFDVTYEFRVEGDRVTGFERRSGEWSEFFRRLEQEQETTSAESAGVPEAILRSDQTCVSPNWPCFRGTGARGIGDGQSAPDRWDVPKGTNVRWQTRLPGLGHSSPIVWGDKIFVTTAISSVPGESLRTGLMSDFAPVPERPIHTWQVICLDKSTGSIRWQATAHRGIPKFGRHPKSTYANPTPVTDGKYVVAFFGTEGLYCYDMDGRLQWQKSLGDLNAGWFYDPDYQWGFGSSPLLVDGTLFLQCDVQEHSFAAALDVATGDERWRVARDEIPSWASPNVVPASDGALLVTNATRAARAYRVDDGSLVWQLPDNSEICVPTPFEAYGLMFLASGYRPVKPIYAIRRDARGDLSLPPGQTASKYIAWSRRNDGPYLTTPIAYRGLLYVCSDSGVLSCYDALTGKRHYQQRLRSSGARSYAASPVAADGRLYFTSEEGIVMVVEAGPSFRLVAANPLGGPCLATPAISQGMMFFRTEHRLIAVGYPPR